MLLPVTQHPPGSSGRWTRYHTTVSVGFCTLLTWLLTHCLVFHDQPFNRSNVLWTQQHVYSHGPVNSWPCQTVTQAASLAIGYQSNRESRTGWGYVFWCSTFILVRLHNIWVTVSPRSLHPWTGTDSDRVTQLTTYCREHAPSLANVVSTTPVRPPGTLCHLTYVTLLTLAYSRNDLKPFCLIVRTDLLLLLYGAPGRFVERCLTNLSLYLYLYHPRRGWPRRNFVKVFDADKTRMIGLPYGEKNYDNMLSRFHLIPERWRAVKTYPTLHAIGWRAESCLFNLLQCLLTSSRMSWMNFNRHSKWQRQSWVDHKRRPQFSALEKTHVLSLGKIALAVLSAL